MTIEDYQKLAFTTALPVSQNINYMALGLAGEAGEVANKVKKIMRDGDSPQLRAAIRKELGDTLWYAASLATVMGMNLNDIAEENLGMLRSRMERQVIRGSGDER